MNKVIGYSLLFISGVVSAQNSTAQMNASEMFGDKATADGPITVCSNTLSYDQSKHQMIYAGNVLVMQTKNANIQCTDQVIPEQQSSGVNNYSFASVSALSGYTDQQKEALKTAKEICKTQGGCRFLAGQTLTIFFDKSNKKIENILLTTGKNYTAKFYSLPFPKVKKGKTQSTQQEDKVYARGQTMSFDMKTNQLIIQKNAYIDRGGNQFAGDKVIYDIKNGLVTVPNTGERATVILNNLNSDKD
ncbi:LptA/OstA family protein [Facilibium subflavum]|uniref:LptA/OstA family protein n=1 Tax=Facilibium subflavum TaxID=2219058 RepID=UPI0013C2FBDA|nr:LptA/OstA family protein [Facilibium subflavum]